MDITNKDFDSRQPIYQQIIDKILTQIARGDLAPGAKVASVRELAVSYGVNPNTMQRSLAKLEEAGYLHTERTSGRFVTDDMEMIEDLKQQAPRKLISDFVQEMIAIGVEAHDICAKVSKYIERMDKDGECSGN